MAKRHKALIPWSFPLLSARVGALVSIHLYICIHRTHWFHDHHLIDELLSSQARSQRRHSAETLGGQAVRMRVFHVTSYIKKKLYFE